MAIKTLSKPRFVPFIQKTLLGLFHWGITLHPVCISLLSAGPVLCSSGTKRGTIGLTSLGSTLRIVDPETLEDLPIGEMISLGAVEETVSQTIVDGDVKIAVVTLPGAKKGEKGMVLLAG